MMQGPQYGWFAARAVGDELVVPLANAQLPPICCKCGTSAEVRGRLQKLTWSPWLAYLGLLLGVIPGVLVVYAMQKSTTLLLPICPLCDARWSRAMNRWSLAVAAPFVLPCVAAVAILVADRARSGAWLYGGLSVFVALLAVPALTRVKYVRPHVMWPSRIDDSAARLRGASPALLRGIAPDEPLLRTNVHAHAQQ
jgi:hypothetical protein